MKNIIFRIGIAVLVVTIMAVGYGGWCDNKKDDTSAGSSTVTVEAPSALTGTVTAGTITLNWTDNSSNETSFGLYVKEYTASGWSIYTASIPANATSFSLPASNLSASPGNFQFSVSAYNSTANVESTASNIISLSW
jgi:hypothetical protein